MATQIIIVQGHPDPGGGHHDQALAAALDFPLITTKQDFERGEPPECIRRKLIGMVEARDGRHRGKRLAATRSLGTLGR